MSDQEIQATKYKVEKDTDDMRSMLQGGINPLSKVQEEDQPLASLVLENSKRNFTVAVYCTEAIVLVLTELIRASDLSSFFPLCPLR